MNPYSDPCIAAAAGGADLRAEAEQGLRVWAPLANRLGVWSLKAELEDLCFLVRVQNVKLWIV
jgi:(p)ppGpp synthase/HD superfamily hydrolase